MPRISEFYCITIAMFYNDHEPAHFHAVYGEFRAQFAIRPVGPLRGSVPARARGLILEWAKLHQDELEDNWLRAKEHKRLERIEPLP